MNVKERSLYKCLYHYILTIVFIYCKVCVTEAVGETWWYGRQSCPPVVTHHPVYKHTSRLVLFYSDRGCCREILYDGWNC